MSTIRLLDKRYHINEYNFSILLGSRVRNLVRVAAEELEEFPRKPDARNGAYETEEEARAAFEKLKGFCVSKITKTPLADGSARYEAEFDLLELVCTEGTGLNTVKTIVERWAAPPQKGVR